MCVCMYVVGGVPRWSSPPKGPGLEFSKEHKVRNSPDVGHLLSMASARTQAGDQSCSKCFRDIMQGIGYKGLKGQRANRNEAS